MPPQRLRDVGSNDFEILVNNFLEVLYPACASSTVPDSAVPYDEDYLHQLLTFQLWTNRYSAEGLFSERKHINNRISGQDQAIWACFGLRMIG